MKLITSYYRCIRPRFWDWFNLMLELCVMTGTIFVLKTRNTLVTAAILHWVLQLAHYDRYSQLSLL